VIFTFLQIIKRKHVYHNVRQLGNCGVKESIILVSNYVLILTMQIFFIIENAINSVHLHFLPINGHLCVSIIAVIYENITLKIYQQEREYVFNNVQEIVTGIIKIKLANIKILTCLLAVLHHIMLIGSQNYALNNVHLELMLTIRLNIAKLDVLEFILPIPSLEVVKHNALQIIFL
jgi:hypothetical protein